MLLKPRQFLQISAFVLGFSSLVAQVIFLRKFLAVYRGNELVIGLLFANWMVITGLGAMAGRIFSNRKSWTAALPWLQLIAGAAPYFTVFLIEYSRNLVFVPGKMVGLPEIALTSMILLLPFTFISGALFTAYSSVFDRKGISGAVGKTYAFEAAGGIAGGIFFYVAILSSVNDYAQLRILFVVSAALAVFWLAGLIKPKLLFPLPVAAVLTGIIVFMGGLSDIALQSLYPGQQILHSEETPYGNITVTETAGQINFLSDGIPNFSSDNVIVQEEMVHYALAQIMTSDSILMIGGGLEGALAEALKHNPLTIDFVEQNPFLIEITDKYTSNLVPDNRIRIHRTDARRFIKQAPYHFDAILVNIADPDNARLNRLYTLDFFLEMRRVMNPGAIFSISISSSGHYLSKEAVEFNSVIYNTLRKVFPHVIIIPGNRHYFLASENKPTYAITEQLTLKGIENEYVNYYYLDDSEIKRKGEEIAQKLSDKSQINKDFRPYFYYQLMQQWMRKSDLDMRLIPGVVILFLLLPLVFRKGKLERALYITGFSGTAHEFILIVAFQALYGYIYLMGGAFIALFMAGLFTGSHILIKRIACTEKNFAGVQMGIGTVFILTLLILLLLKQQASANDVLVFALPVILFIMACLTGIQFVLASAISKKNVGVVASGMYSSDMAGSALGAILMSVILVPLTGFINACLFVGLLNFVTGALIYPKKK